jgi:hypothetical protein
MGKFSMDESRPVATPMAMKLHNRKPDSVVCDGTMYQSIIERLVYIMTAPRPDIAYAIGVLSWYNHEPNNRHMVALEGVLRYRNGTNDWRQHFGGALSGALGENALGGEEDGSLGCCIDSDNAGCPDDYKSTSG